MQGNPRRPLTRRDHAVQRAILALALEINPMYRTIPELGREFRGRREVERAVKALVAAGLVELHGTTVMATKAALRFQELDW